MKGLSRKNFSQVGRRLDDWFSTASLPVSWSEATTVTTPRSESRNFRDPLDALYLAANPRNSPEAGSTLTLTPLLARPFVLLFEPDSNSR